MLPALPLLASLASMIPAAARLFGGEDAAKAAAPIADIARSLTGAEDQAGIVTALQASPEALAKLTAAVQEVELGLERERTRKLEVINATMQAESKSNDAFVRRMRPTFGYVMAATWAVQMGATSWAIVDSPKDAPAVLAALAETWWLWTVALSVLGIYVAGRSKEKGASLLEALPFPIPGRKPR